MTKQEETFENWLKVINNSYSEIWNADCEWQRKETIKEVLEILVDNKIYNAFEGTETIQYILDFDNIYRKVQKLGE
jgi:hypothetical protein